MSGALFPGTLSPNIERMNDRTKNILVSIVQGLVSLPFLMGGTMKIDHALRDLVRGPQHGLGR